jgi:hypothetical protein
MELQHLVIIVVILTLAWIIFVLLIKKYIRKVSEAGKPNYDELSRRYDELSRRYDILQRDVHRNELALCFFHMAFPSKVSDMDKAKRIIAAEMQASQDSSVYFTAAREKLTELVKTIRKSELQKAREDAASRINGFLREGEE